MVEEVYNFLLGYGFSIEQINYIEDINENIYLVTEYHAKKIIEFLKKFDLNKIEIINIISNNPEIISQKEKNLLGLYNLYKNYVNFSDEDIKNILINKTHLFIINYKKIKLFIESLQKKSKTDNEIRQQIINLNENI